MSHSIEIQYRVFCRIVFLFHVCLSVHGRIFQLDNTYSPIILKKIMGSFFGAICCHLIVIGLYKELVAFVVITILFYQKVELIVGIVFAMIRLMDATSTQDYTCFPIRINWLKI